MYTATLGYTSAALAVSEMVSKLTTDVNDFINAEPDAPIPPSLRQAVRLINTPELEECAARVTSGITRGVTTVASAAMGGDGDASTSGAGAGASEMVDRVLDKILNPANWGLVSVVVSGATRQTLETIIDTLKERYGDVGGDASSASASASSTLNDALETTLRLAASDRGRGLLLDACSAFVSAAVGTYLDKTADSNTFDDFFAAALAASNRDAFSDIAGRVTGEAVRTVVEVVSPGMMSPRAPDAGARSRARRRDGRRRDDENGYASPGAAPASSSSVAREVFPESPRDVRAADEAFGTSGETETETPSSSPSQSTSSRDAEAFDARDAASDSAAAAARFTSALVNDLTPHAFRAMTSADGRRLIAEVAGTCTASATRSLVLAVRDCVFFVETRDPKNGARGVYAATGIAALRAMISVVFVVWLMASAYASVCAAGASAARLAGAFAGGGAAEAAAEAAAAAAEGAASAGRWWGRTP